MPTFSTPEPISVTIEVAFGDVRFIAGERSDTVVEVRPSDASHPPDVHAAELTRVEYATGGRLQIRGAKQRGLGHVGKVGSIDIIVQLPAGSRLRGAAAGAAFRATGELGDCQLSTATGDIELEHASTLNLSTAGGAIVVGRAAGDAEVSTASGNIRLRQVDGTAALRSANGDSWIGEAGGDVRVTSANGDIIVDVAHADITARTANGDVRIGAAARGSASLKAACGEIEVGIPTGTAARLDLHTSIGRVRNLLDTAQSPDPSDQRIEVHARTGYGDIVIRRAEESRMGELAPAGGEVGGPA